MSIIYNKQDEIHRFVFPGQPGPMSRERLIFVTYSSEQFLTFKSTISNITDDMKQKCIVEINRLCEPWEFSEALASIKEFIVDLEKIMFLEELEDLNTTTWF